jgi:dihydrolipoamide dehydrogenase
VAILGLPFAVHGDRRGTAGHERRSDRPTKEDAPVDDFVVIGAGAAGEAAAHEARRRGASVTVVERELLGGSCPFWACMPSKTLLHAAGTTPSAATTRGRGPRTGATT